MSFFVQCDFLSSVFIGAQGDEGAECDQVLQHPWRNPFLASNISTIFFTKITTRKSIATVKEYEKFVFYHDQTVTYICIRLKYRSSKFKKKCLFYLQSRCTECSGKIKTNMWWLILM